MDSHPRRPQIPSPLTALFVAIALAALTAGVWIWSYAQRRIAAIAYIEGNDGFVDFSQEPLWLPESISMPLWLRSADRINSGSGDGCDFARVVALHETRWLECADGVVDDKQLREIGRLRKLRQLDIGRTTATDTGIAHLRNCRGLESLTICRSAITDEGLKALAGLPLKCLELDGAPIGDSGLKHLAELPLSDLSLDGTQVTDTGISHLAELPLSRVNLERTRVTRSALGALLRISGLKKVEASTPPFIEADATELQRAGIQLELSDPKVLRLRLVVRQ